MIRGTWGIAIETETLRAFLSSLGVVPLELQTATKYRIDNGTLHNLCNAEEPNDNVLNEFPLLSLLMKQGLGTRFRRDISAALFVELSDHAETHSVLDKMFESACDLSRVDTKIVEVESVEYQYLMTLSDTMCDFFTTGSGVKGIKDEYVEKINQVLEQYLSQIGLNETSIGDAYLVLALMLVKLSSSAFWGVETNSPEPLRVIATGMLSLARDSGSLREDLHAKWGSDLSGNNCTAILSNQMSSNLTERQKIISGLIFPAIWGV